MANYPANQAKPEPWPGPKDPGVPDQLYQMNWSTELGTEAITDATVEADTGITVAVVSFASQVVTLSVGGGVAGKRYNIKVGQM